MYNKNLTMLIKKTNTHKLSILCDSLLVMVYPLLIVEALQNKRLWKQHKWHADNTQDKQDELENVLTLEHKHLAWSCWIFLKDT